MNWEELELWLRGLTIVGREEDEDEDEDPDDEGGDKGGSGDDDENEDDDDNSGDGDDDAGDDPVKLKEKLAAKEEALRKERSLRRKAEREARKKKRTRPEPDDKKKGADSELQKQLEAERQRGAKLAEGLRKKSIDDAILEAARNEGFIDPTDALTDDIRKEVDWDQDEEDPTDIDIDEESVIDAVKNLAAKKKHLVGEAPPKNPSGGKFKKRRGSGDKDEKSEEQVMKERYPALR